MHGEIEIRLAELKDVEQIQEVFYQTWLATYPNEEAGVTLDDIHDRHKDRMSPERLEKRRKDVDGSLPNTRMFVAEIDGQVAGICRVTKESAYGHLDAIYVLPEHQGKGAGKLLWRAALEFLGTDHEIRVEVATYNTRAIDFYTRLGFDDTGVRFEEERLRMKSGANIPQMRMVLKPLEP